MTFIDRDLVSLPRLFLFLFMRLDIVHARLSVCALPLVLVSLITYPLLDWMYSFLYSELID